MESTGITPIGSRGFLFLSAIRYPTPRSTVISISRFAPLPSVAMWRSGFRISTPAGGETSPDVTSPGPFAFRYTVTGSSRSERITSSLRLRMMSVTSSVTLGIVENSWSTPSIRTDEMAAPGIDESNVRRSELPTV